MYVGVKITNKANLWLGKCYSYHTRDKYVDIT